MINDKKDIHHEKANFRKYSNGEKEFDLTKLKWKAHLYSSTGVPFYEQKRRTY